MDYIGHLISESATFSNTLASVDPGAVVPSCPEWDAVDLAWHLTEWQWFWGTIVSERLSDPESAEETKPDRPNGMASTLELFDTASARLAEALATAAPNETVWTWHVELKDVGFIRRRQAHEAMIHRADAQLAAGDVPHLPTEMAADGIDELLRIHLTGFPDWASFTPDGNSVRLRATDADRRWGVSFGRMTGTSPSGNTYDLEAVTVGQDAVDPQLVLEGPASALDLWLWGRGPLDEMRVAGSRQLVDRLRAVAAESTE